MRQVKVEIKRDELTSITTFVAPWEVPILKAIHREVDIKGEVDGDAPYPTRASEEFTRLGQVYGSVEGSDKTHAEDIYGTGTIGAQNLGTRIREAINIAKTKPAKAPPPDVVASTDSEDEIENPYGTDPDVIESGESVVHMADSPPATPEAQIAMARSYQDKDQEGVFIAGAAPGEDEKAAPEARQAMQDSYDKKGAGHHKVKPPAEVKAEKKAHQKHGAKKDPLLD